VDVIINGSAHAGRQKLVEELCVRVRLGSLDKRLIVSGDRSWSTLRGRSPSRPEQFASMPIVYERAFGGSEHPDKMSIDTRNPVGVGFRGAVSADPEVRTRVPNVEYVGDRMTSPSDRIRPAGFGVVARSWEPRVALAGTYDERWLAEQCPLPPLDFSPLHFQAAPIDQQVDQLSGGETALLENMTPEGRWQFRLPRLEVPLRACSGRRITKLPMRMDTVILEPDLFRVSMTLRAAIPILRHRRPVEEYVVGHVSSAWERARTTRKYFFDTERTEGALRGATYFFA
jgi:hypothetical protein